MAAASKPLYDLQDIDSRIASEKAMIDSIDKRLLSDPETDALKERVAALDSELAGLQASLRLMERRAEELASTAKRLNDMLYGGSIHDAREMASAEAEIDHAKRQQSAVEDEEIELLERSEAIDAQLDEARPRLQQRIASRDGDVSELRAERMARRESTAQLEAGRKELMTHIDGRQLDVYTRLRSRLGHAVSRVDSGLCQWCRVQVPAKDVQHARGETIVNCTNCGRILYAE